MGIGVSSAMTSIKCACEVAGQSGAAPDNRREQKAAHMNLYQFSLNGAPVQVQATPDRLLLEVLRENLKITSVKNGCAPQQACGACLILIDGVPKNSCALTMRQGRRARKS